VASARAPTSDYSTRKKRGRRQKTLRGSGMASKVDQETLEKLE